MSTKKTKRTKGSKGRGSSGSRSAKGPRGPIASRSASIGYRGGFPDVFRTTLVYTDVNTLTLTTGVGADHVYRLDSCFDPDFTGGGNQPANYDLFSTVYNAYRVRATRVTLRPVATNAAIACGGLILANSLSTSLTTVAQITSRSMDEWAQVFNISTNGAFAGDNDIGPGLAIRANYSPAAVHGLTPSEYNGSDNNRSSISGNPADPGYIHVCAYPLDVSSSTTVYYAITIEYDVDFLERVSQSFSLEELGDRIEMLKQKKLRTDSKTDRLVDEVTGPYSVPATSTVQNNIVFNSPLPQPQLQRPTLKRF